MASERQMEHTFEGTFSKPFRCRCLLHLPKGRGKSARVAVTGRKR